MAGVVHVNWYATLFRGDSFAAALEEITAVSLRYGASEYAVYRSRDVGETYTEVNRRQFHAISESIAGLKVARSVDAEEGDLAL